MIKFQTDTAIGNIPSDWDKRPLRQLLMKHLPGNWGEDRGEQYFQTIRSTNLTNFGHLDLTDVAVRSMPMKVGFLLQPLAGDILLERSGGGPGQPVGRVGLVREDMPGFAFSNFLQLLRPNEDCINPVYLCWVLYYLNRTGRIVRLEQQTTQMRNLNFRDYLTLVVPVPPATEQEAITCILNATDVTIERTRTALASTERLKRGLVQAFFEQGLGRISSADRPGKTLRKGWRLVPTKELLVRDPKNGISPVASPQPPGYPTFSIAAVRNGKIDLMNEDHRKYVRIRDEVAAEFAVNRGDLLIVRGNANPELVGRCGMVADYPEECIYPDILKRVVFRDGDDGLIPEYACIAWNHPVVHNQVLKLAKTSNGTLKINSKDVKQIIMPVPPKPEQEQLVELVGRAEKSLQCYQRRGVQLERLKRGLMQDLLTGRVRVKLPAASSNGVVRSRP